MRAVASRLGSLCRGLGLTRVERGGCPVSLQSLELGRRRWPLGGALGKQAGMEMGHLAAISLWLLQRPSL